MDPALLAQLPDAAKLGILRHLAAGSTETHTVRQLAQQQEAADALQGCASRSPAILLQKQAQRGAEAAPAGSSAPALVQRRRLEGGLAVIDGFLDVSEVKAAREEAQAVLAGGARSAGMAAAPNAAQGAVGGTCPGNESSGGAGGGAEARTWANAAARGDCAAWLSPAALQSAGCRRLAGAVQSLLALRPWLEWQGYDVGGRPSVQLACYPGGGARYVRHRDASASVPHRSVTAILYLNPVWEAAHGGCLCVYNHGSTGSDPRAASAADLRLASGTAADGGRISSLSSTDHPLGAQGLALEGRVVRLEQQQRRQGQQGQAACAVGSGLDEGHCATVVPPVGGRLVVMNSRLLHEVLPAQEERYALTVWFSRTPQAQQPKQQQQAQQQALQRAEQQQGQAQLQGPEQPAEQQVVQQEQAPSQQQQTPSSVPCDQHQGQSALVPGPTQQQGQQSVHTTQQQEGLLEKQPALVPALDDEAVTAPEHIFVSIPAYRDSEAQWTMADLFAEAANPDRVRVGVVWQVELPADAEFVRLAGDQRWLAQVRQVVLPASEATGPCKARALAQQLWEGEEYYLQVDSHMRFTPGWDAALLRMLRQAEATAGHPRVVLSTYPPGYEGEGPTAALPPDPLPTVLCASHFGETDGLLRIVGRKLREPLTAPVPALFWAAGFSFSRAQLIQEAPYPRNLPGLFFGEELLQLQRLWCAGWDVFAPPAAIAFHLWSRKHRPTFQAERWAESEAQRQRSQAQVASALAGEEEDAGASSSESSSRSSRSNGLPQHRSLDRFWEHVGVDFRCCIRAISERARNAGWPAEAFLTSGS